MKIAIFILIFSVFSFVNSVALCQNYKKASKGTGYLYFSDGCSFPRQTGKLKVQKEDTLIIFETDSSKMFLHINKYRDKVHWYGYNKKMHKMSFQYDTLAILLFKNGLLTADLLVKAFNMEAVEVNDKGEAVNATKHLDPINFTLYNIEIRQDEKSLKRNSLLFDVLVDYSNTPKHTAAHVYHLVLKSNIKPTKSNIFEFIKQADIECLFWCGIRI